MINRKDQYRLGLLENYWKHNHVMPTYTIIMELTSLSRAGVHKFMKRLLNAGYIERHGHGYKPVIK